MGAACQGTKVADQVQAGAIKSRGTMLSLQAQEHLKSLRTEDPLAEENSFSNTMKAKLGESAAGQREGEETEIKDIGERSEFSNVERMHEPLWEAIEKGNLESASKFLSLNEVEEKNVFDSSG